MTRQCPKCGCQLFDPYGGKLSMGHDIESCQGFRIKMENCRDGKCPYIELLGLDAKCFHPSCGPMGRMIDRVKMIPSWCGLKANSEMGR